MARRLLPAAILIPAVLGWLRLEGQRAGLYDSDFGVALYTVTSMVVFGAIVCCNALSLFRSDTARTKAERRLRGAYEGLERRVRERTAQLSDANAALLTAKDDLEARVGERTATLAESEARLNAILDNGTSIVYLKDLEDRYILVNRCFAKLLGRKKEEIVGRKTSELFPRDAAEQFRRSDLEALASGVALEVEESAHDADGLHTFVSTKFPLRDAAGEIYALCGVAYDITERRRTEEAINEQKQQLQAAVAANQLIMENSRDVICTIDDAGRFLTLSAATKALWGYEPAELIGRPYIDLVYPDDRAKTNDIAAQIVSGDAAHDFENRYVRKDGTLIDVMWSAYWSEADKLMFCVAHDITERTRVTRALKLAEQEANRANHAKSEFLSRMSHELRTPMNAILGFAQLLEMDKLTADQRDGIGHILRGGRHLLELINEVLDISRIEAGCLSLSPEPVEVGDALRETLDLLQPLASAREVRLNPAPDCASFVRSATAQAGADQSRLERNQVQPPRRRRHDRMRSDRRAAPDLDHRHGDRHSCRAACTPLRAFRPVRRGAEHRGRHRPGISSRKASG
jgi:PAS domain S-box-containing protein